MKNCEKCGAQIPEGSAFCQGCGAPVAPAQATPNVEQTAVNNDGFQQPAQPQQPQPQAQSQGNDKGMAILAYIFPLIPFLMKPTDEFVKFHTLQGMNLWIIMIIYSIGSGIVGSILSGLGLEIISYLLNLGSLVLSVFDIMGFVYAIQGKKTELPVVSQIKIIK